MLPEDIFVVLILPHSTRPPAACADVAKVKRKIESEAIPRSNLVMSQGLDWIEASGTRGGVEAGDEADHHREGKGASNQPERYIPEALGRHLLPTQINVGAEVDGAPNHPSECGTEQAAHCSH